MPSPTYSQNKASIMRYKAKNADRLRPLEREYSKMCMRRKRAYQAEVKRLSMILFDY